MTKASELLSTVHLTSIPLTADIKQILKRNAPAALLLILVLDFPPALMFTIGSFVVSKLTLLRTQGQGVS